MFSLVPFSLSADEQIRLHQNLHPFPQGLQKLALRTEESAPLEIVSESERGRGAAQRQEGGNEKVGELQEEVVREYYKV